MTRVLVTGASGFIGSAVCIEALRRGWQIRGAVRSAARPLVEGVERCPIADLRDAELEPLLHGVDAAIHLAAMNGESTPPDRPFRAGDAPQPQGRYGRNHEFTLQMIVLCAAFVFLAAVAAWIDLRGRRHTRL